MFRKSLILGSLIVFSNCNSSKNDISKIENNEVELAKVKSLYSANEFDSLIKNSSSAVLIDVRTKDEYAKGHLKDALNLDWNGTEFKKQLETIDKNQTILIYCLSGGRSNQAAIAMRENGYNNVLELDGGIMAWRTSNLPEISIKRNVEGISLESFKQLIASDEIVLVSFNAAWCAPCKKMKPFIEKIERDYKDKVSVLKIDVDENTDLVKQLNVSGLPVLKLYKEGNVVWEHLGYANEKDIIAQLNKSTQ